jgi:AmmeMemoRadiSam system protein A
MPYEYLLTDDEKRELLRIARTTLREYFYSGRIPPGKPHRDSLTAEAGAFVTLHREAMLRGCIGTQHESKPLYLTVQEMAIAAATRDSRFASVSEGELEELDIEISVLGHQSELKQPSDIRIGEHGLTIEHGGRRGLLLPQVALEQKWTAHVFLAQVCIKAGLSDDAWREDSAQVGLFTAQVFSDNTHPPLLKRRH